MGKWPRQGLRGQTVRLRFTALYAALFLTTAVGLLALTNLLAGYDVSEVAPVPGQNDQQPSIAVALDRIQQLERQLADVHAMQSRQLVMGSLIALAVMAVVSVVLGRIVAGRVLRPLQVITTATRRISAQNLHERLAVDGPADEVKDLADTVDELLERLEASFAAQRLFVANASHELRTPLATMRASLDVALAKPEPAPPQTIVLADRLRVELDRVDDLLEGFLALAQAQHGALGDRGPVSLGELAAGALRARAADVAAKNLTIEANTQEIGLIEGSPALLFRMVDNVLENAILHNEDGGWIRVAATAEQSAAQLVVESGGSVLEPEQVARLAQPFQRLAADRTGNSTGAGLGLSIVAAVIRAHGGRLDLEARPDGGLRVTVSLPAAPVPQGVAA